MGELPSAKERARFVGIIEHLAYGWRASYGLRVPGEVFLQQGEFEVFATELEAAKWLHVQADTRGFSSIEIRRQN
jgi:hypothetical protein